MLCQGNGCDATFPVAWQISKWQNCLIFIYLIYQFGILFNSVTQTEFPLTSKTNYLYTGDFFTLPDRKV